MLNFILDLIDMRSFSSLWYWIAVVVTWSMASHRVLGVPWDAVLRARRRGGAAADDFVALTRLNLRRLSALGRESGVGLTVAASGLATALIVLGFGYGFELAQALAFLVLPRMAVAGLSLRRAARLERVAEAGITPSDLVAALMRHRLLVQAIGFVSLAVTALWGMAHLIRPYL
ncbi:component of SufBCD complex [Paenirhodobacter populi]|uniref:Component of SufBCD complex n=1 Tax=Paenirhodobacter populi TaxID=2306993 RepID=A0A443JA68_9RHOB|nr:component of SufBCD complex [Sinirhodobacter populi]RWR17380.1 component of SufBCD complex [Sinirhodobacter populi]